MRTVVLEELAIGRCPTGRKSHEAFGPFWIEVLTRQRRCRVPQLHLVGMRRAATAHVPGVERGPYATNQSGQGWASTTVPLVGATVIALRGQNETDTIHHCGWCHETLLWDGLSVVFLRPDTTSGPNAPYRLLEHVGRTGTFSIVSSPIELYKLDEGCCCIFSSKND